MPDFAFTPYSHGDHGDSDLLANRKEASRLRDHLKSQGHKAVVERSGSEHRVRVQHPTDRSSIAYVGKDQLSKDGKFSPYWVADVGRK